MLKELGLDPEKDVTWITMGGGSDTRLAALMNGGLAGANIQIRHIATLEAAGGTVVYRSTRTIAQDGYIAMGPFIKANPDTVTAYLSAMIKGMQFVTNLDNKDEVIAIMEKNGFAFSQEFKDTYKDGVQILSPDLGFNIPDMQFYWDELAKTGESAASVPWRKAMNLEYLWKAQELNGLPRRPASL
jgi:ABC-type nitrate/sulfonate/bicarbonate transport system substrate-binding protein